MKKISIGMASLIFSGSLMAAEQVNVKVKGMVCSFCAQGIKKKFEAQKAVTALEVNLDDKWVKFQVKDNEQIEDASITKLITEAGYNVVSIERKPL